MLVWLYAKIPTHESLHEVREQSKLSQRFRFKEKVEKHCICALEYQHVWFAHSTRCYINVFRLIDWIESLTFNLVTAGNAFRCHRHRHGSQVWLVLIHKGNLTAIKLGTDTMWVNTPPSDFWAQMVQGLGTKTVIIYTTNYHQTTSIYRFLY